VQSGTWVQTKNNTWYINLTSRTVSDSFHVLLYNNSFASLLVLISITAGWAISTQDTEATSICLRKESLRSVLSLGPCFLRSNPWGAFVTCNITQEGHFKPLTKFPAIVPPSFWNTPSFTHSSLLNAYLWPFQLCQWFHLLLLRNK